MSPNVKVTGTLQHGGRTVQDFQPRRAVPCRNVSESTDLLERIAELAVTDPMADRNSQKQAQANRQEEQCVRNDAGRGEGNNSGTHS